jgi:hypothetical protein
MKGLNISNITPQQKMVAVNNRFGNTNIQSQQGTTRTLYHTLPADGRTLYRFFENAQALGFPFTNLGAEGNRLGVGDTFTLQKVYFDVIETDPDTGAIGAIYPVNQGTLGAQVLSLGEIDFLIANSQVVKQLPSMFVLPELNFTAVNDKDSSFNFATDIVIPPLLEYVLQLRLAAGYTAANTFIRCTIQGSAGIIAPKTTF